MSISKTTTLATGASGTSAVKYGTMRENTLAVTTVLPPTTIQSASPDTTTTNDIVVAHSGTAALKSSAGYDLTALMTCSEGTLGVITDVTVKLHPIPSYIVAAKCAFDDLHSAADSVAMIRMMGIPVSRIELLDEMSIRAFNKSLGSDSELACTVKPTLFLEFAGHSEKATMEDLRAARDVCLEFEATDFVSESDENTRQKLWSARHKLYYSSIALRVENDGGEGATPRNTLLTDACVPLSHFADILTATARDVEELDVVGTCFGHAGDGNFHCILPMAENDTVDYKQRVFKVNERLIERVLSVNGTCTGEHGVGYGKKVYLKKQYGDGGVKMLERVKRGIDPFNIMNPQKIVDV